MRDPAKEWSVVFKLKDQLFSDWCLEGPEPDFLKWIETALMVDQCNTGDTAISDDIPESEKAVWKAFHDAFEATGLLIDTYRDHPELFKKVAAECFMIPAFLARHPDAERFNRELLLCSTTGWRSQSDKNSRTIKHLAEQSWPTRYAYAIIGTIDLTLDTHAETIRDWSECPGYGIPMPVDQETIEATLKKMALPPEKEARLRKENEGVYQILPAWTEGLQKVTQPIRPDSVQAYWEVGKAMLLEEMPDFHLRPEWESHRRRRYSGGLKPGVLQHAIFKDILSAMKTIAGTYRKAGQGPEAVK